LHPETSVSQFIPPSFPVPVDEPPAGEEWIHEIKRHGWRCQIHRHGDDVYLYSRKGKDLLPRLPELRDALVQLPDCIIDAELVASNAAGETDIAAVSGTDPGLCLWCFDLMAIAGEDIRERSLIERKARLRGSLATAGGDRLRYSEEFSDPATFLASVESKYFEGIISRRAASPYRSGPHRDWVKVLADEWPERGAHTSK
jgi:bifunctional non-homologous end joining protein LigD